MSRRVNIRSAETGEVYTQPPPAPVEKTPTIHQWAAYQGLYTWLNNALWDGRLPHCVLNFSRHAKAYGFFSPERWKAMADDTIAHEISLNPDHLGTRDIRAVVSTLVHEMCHLWQAAFGEPSRSGYHNAEWADEMERVGLMPSDTGEPGGKRKGQKMTHYIIKGGAFARAFADVPPELLMPWRTRPVTTKERKKRESKQKVKYECAAGGGCGAACWGKPGLNLLCLDCREPMSAIA